MDNIIMYLLIRHRWNEKYTFNDINTAQAHFVDDNIHILSWEVESPMLVHAFAKRFSATIESFRPRNTHATTYTLLWASFLADVWTSKIGTSSRQHARTRSKHNRFVKCTAQTPLLRHIFVARAQRFSFYFVPIENVFSQQISPSVRTIARSQLFKENDDVHADTHTYKKMFMGACLRFIVFASAPTRKRELANAADATYKHPFSPDDVNRTGGRRVASGTLLGCAGVCARKLRAECTNNRTFALRLRLSYMSWSRLKSLHWCGWLRISFSKQSCRHPLDIPSSQRTMPHSFQTSCGIASR